MQPNYAVTLGFFVAEGPDRVYSCGLWQSYHTLIMCVYILYGTPADGIWAQCLGMPGIRERMTVLIGPAISKALAFLIDALLLSVRVAGGPVGAPVRRGQMSGWSHRAGSSKEKQHGMEDLYI